VASWGTGPFLGEGIAASPRSRSTPAPGGGLHHVAEAGAPLPPGTGKTARGVGVKDAHSPARIGPRPIRSRPPAVRPAAEKLRVLIADADENALFAEAVTAVLGLGNWIQVVARARNGQEAVELAAALEPDLILLDLELPIVDGIEATRRIRETSEAAVLILTNSDSPPEAEDARAAGAAGFVRKDVICSEFMVRVEELNARRDPRRPSSRTRRRRPTGAAIRPDLR
jgi:CheY-like chemotaxis protein